MSAIVGVFLAVLELVRHHSVRAEQRDLHGEIWIVPGDGFDPTQEIAGGNEYENQPTSAPPGSSRRHTAADSAMPPA